MNPVFGTRGFTLLELVIVILVLGIIAALGMPALVASIDDAQLDAASSEVATALRYAQLAAAGTGRPTRVTVNAAADTVRVDQITHANLEAIMDPSNTELDDADIETGEGLALADHPTERGAGYLISFAESRFGGVDVESASFGGNAEVDFNEIGAPSSGGQVWLGLGDRQVSVSIDELAGRVTISD